MEIKIISTDIAMLKAKKKSKMPAGKGTMITPKIQIKNTTVASDFALIIGAISGAKSELTFGATKSKIFLFAILYFWVISARLTEFKCSSNFSCKFFKTGKM